MTPIEWIDASGPPPVEQIEFGPIVVGFDLRVLRPRPWTLMQSRWAADLASTVPAGPLLELCAGAGQIGLAAAVLAGRALVQVDADPIAAKWARTNADRAGRLDVEVRTARVQDAVATHERFPLVLADPPYLPTEDVGRWPEDPVRAIDGGADGMALVRDCLDVSARHVLPGGAVLLQVAGAAQAGQVEDALSRGVGTGLAVTEVRAVDDARAVVLLEPVTPGKRARAAD